MALGKSARSFTGFLHFAGLAFAALASGGFYCFAYQPLQQRQQEAEIRAEQLVKLQKQSAPEVLKYREMRDELSQMKSSLDEVRQRLSAKSAIETLVREVTEAAAECEVLVKNTDIGQSEEKPSYSQTEITFSCQSGYASICKLVLLTEKITKTVKLSKFELQAETNPDQYSVQLTFVLYSGPKSHDTDKKRGVL